ncbi:DUF5331 domain-containing protein [Nodularia sp. NIES-3585]|uniref:DUF5331 domain-containing protein n=1 Tax=Nodularia sp. NIES-3585 TaxID=1973477 RepID=UPI000B6B49F5|nr:DUF5331 domain-containing protein [Nodularia sp. NIES-3585]GAX35388.1 hypothetical protein NIES3585_14010 [Nodularia sp. NIES-3585]
MNIQQLRQSVKIKWLCYYEQNHAWLDKIRVWGTYNGLRRPSSGFILATLSVLEPQFDQVISFILDLNDNPDQIIAALGLNFNPHEELRLINLADSRTTTQFEGEFLQENYTESKPEPLVTVASKISFADTLTSDLPRLDQPVSSLRENTERIYTHKALPFPAVATNNIPHSVVETLTSDLPRGEKPVSSLRENTERIGTEKLVSSVAVATKVASLPSAHMGDSAKLPTALLSQHKPVRSPLAMTIDVFNKGKTLSSRNIRESRFNHVPVKFGTVLLKINCLTGIFFLRDCLKPPLQSNGNHGKMPPKPKDVPHKVNRIPSTNASSLASWIDEFCQGGGYDPEGAICIRL